MEVGLSHSSAGTGSVALRGCLLQAGVGVAFGLHPLALHALVHLLTDHIHQALKHLLHVDVVLGTGLKKLKSWKEKEGRGDRQTRKTEKEMQTDRHREKQ